MPTHARGLPQGDSRHGLRVRLNAGPPNTVARAARQWKIIPSESLVRYGTATCKAIVLCFSNHPSLLLDQYRVPVYHPGRMSASSGVRTAGNITYNGESFASFVPQRTAAYVDQNDNRSGSASCSATALPLFPC